LTGNFNALDLPFLPIPDAGVVSDFAELLP
jgi:hypothetical protein